MMITGCYRRKIGEEEKHEQTRFLEKGTRDGIRRGNRTRHDRLRQG